MEPLFLDYRFGAEEKSRLDRDGHFVLPAILTAETQRQLMASLARIEEIHAEVQTNEPYHYSAEYDGYLASLIAHPQLLELARRVLGENIRYDHCVSLNRPPGNGGVHWHSHAYAEERPELGFVRIFFYVNGFTADDGGLKVVPGSHLFRDAKLNASTDDELREGWMKDKSHPFTGEPLQIERLNAPPGTVALMWTHAAHAVTPRQNDSDMRWCVVYAYRNPGEPSPARWIREAFEHHPPPGADGLMSLY
jgi:ectoine hydroxylase-related dioxygenase (phytanoyl-CoA dioxygenase family)